MGFYTSLYGSSAANVTGTSNKKIIDTLNDGDNTIAHNLNAEVTNVVCLNSASKEIDVEWNIIDANNVNINISGGGPLVNAIIYIFYNGSSTSGNVPYSINADLNDGDNTINHALNATVTLVNVFNSADKAIPFTYDLIDANNININISGGGPITNCTIYIFYI
jgi:hypothetical protein